MYQTQIKNERPNRLKWGLLISGLVFILLLLIIGYFYVTIMQEKTDGYTQAQQRALNETDITEAKDIQRFHGNKAYFVVTGEDKNSHPLFVFVPFEEEASIITVDQPETHTKDKIKTEWKDNCPTCSLTAITPGVVEDTAVWEINYKTNKDTYVYEYISMEDGTLFEQLRFKKMFK